MEKITKIELQELLTKCINKNSFKGTHNSIEDIKYATIEKKRDVLVNIFGFNDGIVATLHLNQSEKFAKDPEYLKDNWNYELMEVE